MIVLKNDAIPSTAQGRHPLGPSKKPGTVTQTKNVTSATQLDYFFRFLFVSSGALRAPICLLFFSQKSVKMNFQIEVFKGL